MKSVKNQTYFGKKLSKLKGGLFIKLLKELKIIIFTSVTSRLLIWPHRPQRGLGVFSWFQKFISYRNSPSPLWGLWGQMGSLKVSEVIFQLIFINSLISLLFRLDYFSPKNCLIFDTFHSEAVEAVWGQKSRHMFSRLKCPHLRITKHPWFHHEGAFFTLL